MPSALCPPGQQVEVQLGSKLVRISHRGALIKVHPRQQRGGRDTSCCGWRSANSPARLDAACLRALEVDLIDVRRLERILVEALDEETTPQQPSLPPPGRFAGPTARLRTAASVQHAHPDRSTTMTVTTAELRPLLRRLRLGPCSTP